MKTLSLFGSSALRSGVAFAFAVAAATPAYAQDDQETSDDQGIVEPTAEVGEGDDPAIVITGSRIRRPNLESTVPITSVDAQQLTEQASVSLGDALNDLPSLRSTFSQSNSTRFIGTAGINRLDLRGLGTNRTLVLVNGRRHVTSSIGSYDVDINTIPSDLVERVDIVTGGNSAIYGSDAVAGVVNFIMRTDFEGLALRAQNGITQYGDRNSFFVSGTWGRNFLDNTLNVAVSVEYAEQDALFFSQRPELTGPYTGVPGFSTVDFNIGEPAAGDGIPDTAFFPGPPGITFGFLSLGGTVRTSCIALTAANQNDPLVLARRAAVCTGSRAAATAGPNTGGELEINYHFLPDGTLVKDNVALDLRPIGGSRFGGLSATGVEGAQLNPGLQRTAVNLLMSADIAPYFQPFVEAKYVWITSQQTSTQPTFVNGTLSPTFRLDNPFLTEQARNTIRTIIGVPATNTTAAFTFNRFNNDIGTRAEDHERSTFRVVAGFRGDLASNWRYEAAFNYGRTETFYETGGNVLVANFNRAADAVLNAQGAIVCRVNADTNPNNDDPACRPINLFGFGAPASTPDGLDYVLYTSSRNEWAEQINATAFVSGDTSGWFELPGGPIGVALGVEFRREDAYSDYDDVTQSGATFLNAISEFDPPAVEVREIFGELRIPILRDVPFFHELTLEGAGRYSDYSSTGGVWAYNAGVIWSPVRDIRFRGGYARSVRAPNLSNLFATQSQTFANGLVDPCSQTVIGQNPNRARNCAEAGIPTTIVVDGVVRDWVNTPASGVSGFNQGNPNLQPERGESWTVGAVIQPRWVPGLAISVDWYDITITEAISGLTGQAIINRCYDDPVSINNPFCAAVFRRRTPNDPLTDFTFDGQGNRTFPGTSQTQINFPVLGPAFLNQPFNFQALKARGVDFDVSYRRQIFDNVQLSARALVSWLDNRVDFTFITDPTRSTRNHGVLGDPEWAGSLVVGLDFGEVDVTWDMDFIDRMTIDAWEVMNSHQGRDPTNADLRSPDEERTPRVFYHALRVGFEPSGTRHRIYLGVDNLFNRNPPLGLTGTGEGSAIYSNTGRFFYAGAQIRF